MRQSTRHAMRERGIPARHLFPPLPSQAEIWLGEAAAPPRPATGPEKQSGYQHLSWTRGNRTPSLPALPFAELLLPFGMMTLSLLG